VFNAAPWKEDGKYFLLTRVETLEGNSLLWLARSDDGYKFIPDPAPCLTAETEGSRNRFGKVFGIEDPRVTIIDGWKVAAYTVFTSDGVCAALSRTKDFITWEWLGVGLPDTRT